MNKVPRPVTIDFETHGIEGRPAYPPVPVGVSIKYPGKEPHYYGWGHPSENNCTYPEALLALQKAWAAGENEGLLFQNGKFDTDVAETHMGLPMPAWGLIHDTLFLLFLDDPHQKELGLKPSAERLLKMPPEERDEVGEWLVEHQPVPNVKISLSPKSEHYYGRYIAWAPGSLVGRYCNGDVVRTEKLFNLLYPSIVKRKMLKAYDRERELMPYLLEIERQGIRVDLPKLEADVAIYDDWFTRLDQWLYKRLGGEINLNSGDQLIEALDKAGLIELSKLGTTEGGKFESGIDALIAAVPDKELMGVIQYRTQLKTCLNTFMKNWLATAKRSGGLIYTNWNQVKGEAGTRTGRLSSHPNFQNLPKEFDPIFRHEEPDPVKRMKLPVTPLMLLPLLPQCRSYVIPWDETHVLIDRDYSQQELRVLAHFEDGRLKAGYKKNKWMDVHDFATTIMQDDYHFLPDKSHKDARKPVKNIIFGLIYGMGIGKMALKNNCTVEVATVAKKTLLKIFPDLDDMYKDMKALSLAHKPIHTWGGREYYCEPAKMIKGRVWNFDYKMLNVLVQGSSADCTKEAMLRYMRNKPKSHKLYLVPHDELLSSVPKSEMTLGMHLMQMAMESIEFGVPMLTEGKVSSKDWASLTTYDEKGKVVYAS